MQQCSLQDESGASRALEMILVAVEQLERPRGVADVHQYQRQRHRDLRRQRPFARQPIASSRSERASVRRPISRRARPRIHRSWCSRRRPGRGRRALGWHHRRPLRDRSGPGRTRLRSAPLTPTPRDRRHTYLHAPAGIPFEGGRPRRPGTWTTEPTKREGGKGDSGKGDDQRRVRGPITGLFRAGADSVSAQFYRRGHRDGLLGDNGVLHEGEQRVRRHQRGRTCRDARTARPGEGGMELRPPPARNRSERAHWLIPSRAPNRSPVGGASASLTVRSGTTASARPANGASNRSSR